MTENFLVWGKISGMISRLKIMDKNGNIEPDLERQEIVKRKFLALIAFFMRTNY